MIFLTENHHEGTRKDCPICDAEAKAVGSDVGEGNAAEDQHLTKQYQFVPINLQLPDGFGRHPIMTERTVATPQTEDGQPIQVGQVVYRYPNNEKRGGSIQELIVQTINDYSIQFQGGNSNYGRLRHHRSNRRSKLYSSLETAQAQRKLDKAEPPWLKQGQFRPNNCTTLTKYLAHMTNIPEENIDAHKTENYLYVCWSKNGLHKEKIRNCKLYSLKEEKLTKLIERMKS